MPNQLIHAASPYLLQHAHNPVDWHEWGVGALDKAVQEDKPILVSIGYSSCHWCHVMERESFENENIAANMNEFFVCIKVDREERPDIDQIYMDAVQLLGVNGGWPLNVFLTPQQKPFFGGTYFTPQAWSEVIKNIHRAYRGNRKQIEETAEELRLHLLTSEVERYKQKPVEADLIPELNDIYKKFEPKLDRTWGGLDKAPKFIMPSIWRLLLRISHITGNPEILDHVTFTLKKIAMGGIYDQVGGGFSRYAVDRYWFAPHFEKMLYDNAQLLSLYSEAYAITKDPVFRPVVDETLEWLEREMTHPGGGFYSALDADSEGVEGKFYTWTREELDRILGSDAPLISAYFGVTDRGNWEHGQNILMRQLDDQEFMKEHGIAPGDWSNTLRKCKALLLSARARRIRPGLDDKIIAGWNAMTICGLVDAYRSFSDERFLNAGLRNMQFIETELMEGNKIYRSYKQVRSTIPAFLDDYAYVIQALIKLYQVTFNEHWIIRAAEIMEYTVSHFFDPADGFFFYTDTSAERLISRKKEIFDNVIPSSNAIMAQNLIYLSHFFDRDEWNAMGSEMTGAISQLIKSEPGYMSQWAIVNTEIKKGIAEIAFAGKNLERLRSALHQSFLPFAITLGTENGSALPLLKDKSAVNGKPTIYVCYNKTCKLPVHSADAAREQLL